MALALDLTGKTFLVTGANSGIGKITALELARAGGHVVLAGRSQAKTEAAIAEIRAAVPAAKLEYLHLDLGDLGAVRTAAESILARDLQIDVLINNAGMAGTRGLTKDGFELTFGTNHIGPYLFTRLLLDRIKHRIVNVSSESHYAAKKIEWDAVRQPTRSVTGMKEYGESKLANVLFSNELARRLAGKGVTSYALHPGVVATDVWRRVPAPIRWVMKLFMISPEKGAEATLRCATDPALATVTGRYYDVGGKERDPNPVALDEQLAGELWRRSAEWVGLA